jgi:RND family efflux transporter MFP subunit
VTTRTRGVLERLEVEEGDWVQQDQALARLEDDEQSIAHRRAQTTLETRRWEYERTAELFQQELVSEEAYEAARREARDAEQAAELAALELSRTVIRAPFEGVILRRHLDTGNTVADGQPVYDLADVDPLYADVNVPERHIARLAPGQTVRLGVDATQQVVEAHIERIAPAVEAATGTVKVTLTVKGDSVLRPGSFVRVEIVTDTHGEALVVPRSALVAEGRRWYVYRLKQEGETAQQVEVELGFEEGDLVEIRPLEEGAWLQAGTSVVVAGAGALSDGAVVQVEKAEQDTPEEADVGT